jgi:hypothetical protein
MQHFQALSNQLKTILFIVMAGLVPAIHVFLFKSSKDVDARHNGMCSGRRSRTRVPGMTSFTTERSA